MEISKREDHNLKNFARRTVSAQIHLLGCVLVIIGAFWLVPMAQNVGYWHAVATAAFLITGFMVFFTSSLYHFLHDGYQIGQGLMELFENLDHLCIYLFIAGTYTPFFLAAVSPTWRGPLLIAVWTIAFSGATYTFLKHRLPKILQSRAVYVSLFVLMGWLLIFRVGEIYGRLSMVQVSLLVAGGAMYSVGALIYALQKPNPWRGIFAYHEIWHVMVLLGFVFHFFLIVSLYASPNCTLSTDTLWITACAHAKH